jgi:hypothetical protein
MVVAVIGINTNIGININISIGHKSDLFIVEGSINANQYIQNVDQLGLIDAVDQKHRPFG